MGGIAFRIHFAVILLVALVGCAGKSGTGIQHELGARLIGDGSNQPTYSAPWLGEDPTGAFPVRMNPQRVEQSGAFPTSKQAAFAPPAALDLLPIAVKVSSYTAADLVKNGADYDTGLPWSRVSQVMAPSVIFSPVWGSVTPPTISDAAYCIYRFSLAGFAGSGQPQTLALGWDPATPPTNFTNLWIGLANRELNHWDWYAGPEDAVLTLASYEPYTAPGGDVLAAVVVLGTDECALLSLTVGVPEMRATGAIPGNHGSDPSPEPATAGILPASVDLSPGCSPISDQGQLGACTSFAAGRGAFDYALGWDYSDYGWSFTELYNRSSAKFLYLLTGAEQGRGCGASCGRDTQQVVDYLNRGGDATELNAPYVNYCVQDWGQEALDDAALLKIQDYHQVDPVGDIGIAKLKSVLAVENRPLVLQTGLDWQFFSQSPGSVWSYAGGPVAGYHAMCIVGYDDPKQAFKVRNSWGDAWNESGYCWIDYQTFRYGATSLKLWCWILDVDYSPTVAARYCDSSADLAPPSNIQASDGLFADKITVTWERSPGATAYEIYRDDPLNRFANADDVTSFDDTWVSGYKSHVYWIKATAPGKASMLSTPDKGYRLLTPVINDVTPRNGQTGTEVTFIADVTGGPPLTYAWDFGGGAAPNTSSDVSPTVTLGAVGDYSASLTVSNAVGNATLPFNLQVFGATYTASGYVKTAGGAGIEAVTIYITGGFGNALTDSSGFWSKSGLPEGLYAASPDKEGWSFEPAQSSFEISSADVTVPDFIGTLLPSDAELVTLPAVYSRSNPGPNFIQVYFKEPRIRRDGRYVLNALFGTATPVDQAAFDDILKLNLKDFPVSLKHVGMSYIPYPVIVVQETSNPDDITGPGDPDAIAGITIPSTGGREAGRINVDITTLMLNLPPPSGITHFFCYKLYDTADTEIGWGMFEVPSDAIDPAPLVGVSWGINVGQRGSWNSAEFDTLAISHTLNGTSMFSDTPDVLWVRVNGGTRFMDWNEYWSDDDPSADNVRILIQNESAQSAALLLLPVAVEVGLNKDYVLIHRFDHNDGAGYYYDWKSTPAGDGILEPGQSYNVYLDDPDTGSTDYQFPDQLIVTGSNPNS